MTTTQTTTIQKTFYDDGELKSVTYTDGEGRYHREDGSAAVTEYFPNGRLRERSFYDRSILHRPPAEGPAITRFWDNGKVKQVTYKVNGVTCRPSRFGVKPAYIEYFPSGKVRVRQYYDDKGRLHAENQPALIQYDEQGDVVREVYYDHGTRGRDTYLEKLKLYNEKLRERQADGSVEVTDLDEDKGEDKNEAPSDDRIPETIRIDGQLYKLVPISDTDQGDQPDQAEAGEENEAKSQDPWAELMPSGSRTWGEHRHNLRARLKDMGFNLVSFRNRDGKLYVSCGELSDYPRYAGRDECFNYRHVLAEIQAHFPDARMTSGGGYGRSTNITCRLNP